MKKYILKKCDMNVDELKIKALLEGLEAQNIEEFMRQAKVGDYRNYGKAYFSAVRNKIKEKEPLFITEDGVECFDEDEYISIGHRFSKIRTIARNCYAPYASGVIRFKQESNADEYIWKNKPVFSYEEVLRYHKTQMPDCLLGLAKERIEGL